MNEKEINKLVNDNINYIKSVANHFKGQGVDFDDLVSEGTLALILAAHKFDASRGTKFMAYASPFIRKAMKEAVDKQAMIGKGQKGHNNFSSRNSSKAVSIDAPLGVGNQYTLLDILVNKDVTLADDNTAFAQMLEDLKKCVGQLEERDQQVVRKFYGLGIPHETLAEIAEDMHLKRERVRQIRDKAIRKIAKNTKSKILKSFLQK